MQNHTVNTSNMKTNNPKKIAFQDNEEVAVLEKFKKIVADLDQNDSFLIRFVRARERNLENAETMLRECLAWKKHNNVESYLHSPPPKFMKDEYCLWHSFTGNDYEGNPVLWLPVGGVLAKECIEAGHKEVIHQLVYHLLETAMDKINKSDRAHQLVCIFALENLTMKKIMHIETMQTLYKAFQNMEKNYPEIMKSLVVINAPWYFNIAYNFIKPILSAHTISKLQVFNSNKGKWMEFLQSIMPQESILDLYLDS